jgi:hypothetical protein
MLAAASRALGRFQRPARGGGGALASPAVSPRRGSSPGGVPAPAAAAAAEPPSSPWDAALGPAAAPPPARCPWLGGAPGDPAAGVPGEGPPRAGSYGSLVASVFGALAQAPSPGPALQAAGVAGGAVRVDSWASGSSSGLDALVARMGLEAGPSGAAGGGSAPAPAGAPGARDSSSSSGASNGGSGGGGGPSGAPAPLQPAGSVLSLDSLAAAGAPCDGPARCASPQLPGSDTCGARCGAPDGAGGPGDCVARLVPSLASLLGAAGRSAPALGPPWDGGAQLPPPPGGSPPPPDAVAALASVAAVAAALQHSGAGSGAAGGGGAGDDNPLAKLLGGLGAAGADALQALGGAAAAAAAALTGWRRREAGLTLTVKIAGVHW